LNSKAGISLSKIGKVKSTKIRFCGFLLSLCSDFVIFVPRRPSPFPRRARRKEGVGGEEFRRARSGKSLRLLFFKEQDAESKIFFSLKEFKKMARAKKQKM